MLRGDRNQVIAFLTVSGGDSLEGEIVALRGAAGENNRPRFSADQIGDLAARQLHCFFRLLAENMLAAGGVAVMLGEIGQHHFHDAGINAHRGVVVQVYRRLYH